MTVASLDRSLLWAICLVLLGQWQFAWSEPTPGDVTEDRAVTPEREAAALTFAERHHVELVKLLQVLKKADAKKYETAVRELFRTSERLAKLQSRSPDRYELELQLWKVDSRIKLLTAQSVSGMPEARRAELKGLITERQEIKLKMLQSDRDKLAVRLSALEEEIATLQKEGDVLAEKELDRLLKSVKSKAPEKSTKPVPTESPPRKESVPPKKPSGS